MFAKYDISESKSNGSTIYVILCNLAIVYILLRIPFVATEDESAYFEEHAVKAY